MPGPMWIDDRDPDAHALFRGVVTLPAAAEVAVASWGTAWFEILVDGAWLDEGPWRFHASRPERALARRRLEAGTHVVAVRAHWQGAPTRLAGIAAPCVAIALTANGQPLEAAWRALALPGVRRAHARLNPQLGWAEWADTRAQPVGWELAGFDDAAWGAPLPVDGTMPTATVDAPPMRRDDVVLTPSAQGRLVERFGYEPDAPQARFLLRDLAPAAGGEPAQGVWRRYDLGRIRLGRPRLVLDLPAGAVIEMAMAETLHQGRVAPWITLSAGASFALDHWVARGGVQTFTPVDPRAGRWLEWHVLANPERVAVVSEGFLERGTLGEPEGAFTCGDVTLERIWRIGIDSVRACAEDGVIDNPTRERGQWTGDAAAAIEPWAVGWSDLRVVRRSLTQAALDARADGMVSGLSPATGLAMPVFASLWARACVRHHELSGDPSLLIDLADAAERNVAAYAPFVRDDLLRDGSGWGFVDWGYVAGDPDLALNLHYLRLLQSHAEWRGRIGRDAKPNWIEAGRVGTAVAMALRARRADGGWPAVGFHATVLALRLGMVPRTEVAAALDAVEAHVRSCFPLDASAPRLSDPAAASPRLITPFFMAEALPALADHGRTRQALDLVRACWGWMLAQGATTCLEVFDTRWSWCHAWSACPTALLPRWLLGIERRFDRSHDRLVIDPRPCGLLAASGVAPTPAGPVSVSWRRVDEGLRYRLTVPERMAVEVRLPQGAESRTVEGETEWLLPLKA